MAKRFVLVKADVRRGGAPDMLVNVSDALSIVKLQDSVVFTYPGTVFSVDGDAEAIWKSVLRMSSFEVAEKVESNAGKV